MSDSLLLAIQITTGEEGGLYIKYVSHDNPP